MKVNEATIVMTKVKPFDVSVGQEYKSADRKASGVFTVTDIDVNDSATYISVVDENDKNTTYGSKTFYTMYKPIKRESE